MSRFFHYDFDGRPRFITFNTHRRLPLLTNNRIRSAVLDAFRYCREKYSVRLEAYVIMPEHVHLVLTPSIEVIISKVIADIKAYSSRIVLSDFKRTNNPLLEKLTIIRNRKDRRVFWQRRCYDHNIRDEESFWTKVNYCHNNPVKRGLVKSPERWVWSSYNYYFGDRNSLLEMDYKRIIKRTAP